MEALPRLSDLLIASHTIFGQNNNIRVNFLKCLTQDMLKKEFRIKAMHTHPDRAEIIGKSIEVMNNEFNKVSSAFEMLNTFIINGKKTIDDIKYYENKRKENTAQRLKQKTKYYEGEIPQWRLLFGQYLYFSILISWNLLIESIVWQRNSRPNVGQLAIDLGILNFKDVSFILKNKNYNEKFGEFALKAGYFDKINLDVLLKQQNMLQNQIGRFFIEKNIFNDSELLIHIKNQKIHNSKLVKR
ncbi:MAG: hypothetical protein KAR38_02550 [Calditrichia bacterium]|nr:hypothetical protein [Calditrichia bacterium]